MKSLICALVVMCGTTDGFSQDINNLSSSSEEQKTDHHPYPSPSTTVFIPETPTPLKQAESTTITQDKSSCCTIL